MSVMSQKPGQERVSRRRMLSAESNAADGESQMRPEKGGPDLATWT